MKYLMLVILYLLLGCTAAFAQVVSGEVVDEGDMPLAGMWVSSGDEHVQTDEAGKFVLNNEKTTGVINVLSLGYKQQMVTIIPGQSFYLIKMEPAFVNLNNVTVSAKKLTGENILRQTVKLLRQNYLPTNVPLYESFQLHIYKSADDTNISLSSNLVWYNKKGRRLKKYNAYSIPGSPVHFSAWNLTGIDPLDYLYNYNDYPYNGFADDIIKIFEEKHLYKNELIKILPDVKKGKKDYWHIIILQRPEEIQNYQSVVDVLIDKEYYAMQRIRCLYFSNNYDNAANLVQSYTENSAKDDFFNSKWLTDDDIKMLFFEVNFNRDSATKKWYPASYTLKNNFVFHPYMEYQHKERTIWMEYKTISILKTAPPENTRITVPYSFYKSKGL